VRGGSRLVVSGVFGLIGVLLFVSVPLAGTSGAARAEERLCADPAPAPLADRDAVAEVHRAAVDCLWELGVVRGTPDHTGRVQFDPHSPVSRAQLVGMLHRAVEATDRGGSLPEPQRPRFADVPAGHPFDREVHTLAAAGIIRGTGSRAFDPHLPVLRGQTASVLVRTAEWASGGELQPAGGPYFRDIADSVHRDAIEVAFEYGLVEGALRPCGDGRGRHEPMRQTARQQAASVIVRALVAIERVERGESADQRPDDECPELRWAPRIDAAADYARTRAGSVSFAAIGTDGRLVGHRADTRVAAASVLKVMFMVAYLDHPDVRGRTLALADRDLLGPMIRHSANDPATRIANMLGPDPMYRLATRAEMRDFSYTRPWGLSRTSARDQASFMLQADRYIPERHRAYALGLLTEITPSQRWGVGEVPTPGWTKHFKGGWGSGTGAVNHQVVMLQHEDGARVALAVMTTSSPDHRYGEVTLREVFRRLLADLPPY
jgi:hypothetical protein